MSAPAERACFTGASMGSEKETNGRARLAKAFLKSPIFLSGSWTNFSISTHTSPVTIAVVVAIAYQQTGHESGERQRCGRGGRRAGRAAEATVHGLPG